MKESFNQYVSLFSENAKYGTEELKASQNTVISTIHKSKKETKTVNDCVLNKLVTTKPWFHPLQT